MPQLTKEAQELINTDFGEEIEKIAAARVDACDSVYIYGFNKMASEVADAMDSFDKTAAEDGEKEEKEEEEDEEEMDEESEKQAAELGAFIERGFFDGLRKLGSDRHGDALHYLAPYLIEKTAEMAAHDAAEKMAASLGEYAARARQAVSGAGRAVAERGRAAAGKAKAWHGQRMQQGAGGVQKVRQAATGEAPGKAGIVDRVLGRTPANVALTPSERRAIALQGLTDIGKGYGAYAGAGAAGLAGAGYGAKKVLEG